MLILYVGGSRRRLAEASAKPNQPVPARRGNTHTASNDADIRPSLVRLSAQNRAKAAKVRQFASFFRRIRSVRDSLA